MARRRTATSNFGASRRESHDASGFYARFSAPVLSKDDTVAAPTPVDEPFVLGDARNMDVLKDDSVALVVTSPPYFAGKAYEEELTREGIPASYVEYLIMLRDVFAECVRVLEPGGRIAVNVANLGRKPFRSLGADVTRILQDDLQLLLRGEVVWRKGEGASGNCAWGSFRSPGNPTMRDLTERVIIASKGRFDRARTNKQRRDSGLPHEATVSADEYMASTLDVWTLPTESARRVGHPAPFPLALPERLIQLHTYADDLVLDPFMGSGTTLVAASRSRRRFIGYDLDPSYVELARQRVAAQGGPLSATTPMTTAMETALTLLVDAGFTIEATKARVARMVVPAVVTDRAGRRYAVDVSGGFTVETTGLARADTVWRAIGRAVVLKAAGYPVLHLTTSLPERGTEGAAALKAVSAGTFAAVVGLTEPAALAVLAALAG